MAQESKNVVPTQKTGSPGSSGMSGARAARQRKAYTHVMTEPERFALQSVQRAQGALRTINEAIKSGKAVRPEVVRLCFQLGQAVGDMLFSTD